MIDREKVMSIKVLQQISFSEEDNPSIIDVRFGIYSPSLDLERVNDELKLIPTVCWKNGDEFIEEYINFATNELEKRIKKRNSDGWVIQSNQMVHSLKVEDHINYLLSKLSPAEEEILHFIKSASENEDISIIIDWQTSSDWGGIQ